MKHFTLSLILMFSFVLSYAQNHLYETFTSGGWPPSGWSIDAQSNNWSKSSTANAGGASPEARFTWQPEFNGTTRLISPVIDLTGVTDLSLEFTHMVDHYGGAYTLGAATRSGAGEWNVIWQMAGATTPPTQVIQLFSNGDVGASDFQFCIFFSGNSYNINDWYIDNIRLFTPYQNDVAVVNVKGGTYYNQGDVYVAKAGIRNSGLSAETFDVTLNITNLDEELLFTETKQINNLAPGVTTEVTFANYELIYSNDAYLISVESQLEGDMDDTNNQKSRYIYTYTTPKDQIVLEIGTGTWCVYCPGAAMGAHDLIENGHNVSVIKYHSGDSYEIPVSAARVSYYGITGFPTSIFDGVEAIVGGSSNQSLYPAYVPIVDGRNLIRTAFDMDFAVPVQNGSSFTVMAMVNKMGPALQSNLKLHFVVTESNIPQNWFNQTHVHNVTRMMLPNANGTSIDMSDTDYLEVMFEFTIEDSWVLDNMEVVIFIQDNDTKEILNSVKRNLNELTSIPANSLKNGLSGIFPNPTTGETTIAYSLEQNDRVSIHVSDLSGRIVATLAEEVQLIGEHKLRYNAAKELNPGIYFVHVQTGNILTTHKLIVN